MMGDTILHFPPSLFGWPLNNHHVIKWCIDLIWYPLGYSLCHWINHIHYSYLKRAFWGMLNYEPSSVLVHLGEAACIPWGWPSSFPNGGIWEDIQYGTDSGIMRWTPCRPSFGKSMGNCCIRKCPWTGVWWSLWHKMHRVCHADRFQGWVSFIHSVALIVHECLLREGLVMSEEPRCKVFSQPQCCPTGVQ